jgi:hypothetical protein
VLLLLLLHPPTAALLPATSDMKVANLLDEEIPQIYALTGRCAPTCSSRQQAAAVGGSIPECNQSSVMAASAAQETMPCNPH